MDRNGKCRYWVLSDLVALRKESVDRNSALSYFVPALKRRSPQGERG